MEEIRFPDLTERLLKLRPEDMSQEQFSKHLGISRAALSNYETGKRIPDALMLKTIAEKTGVSADILLGISQGKLSARDRKILACEYTGLSAEAVEKLHEVACSPDHNAQALEYFSGFVSLFYGRFLHKLLVLEQAVSLAEEILNEDPDGVNMGYAHLRQVLFDFSEFCKKIPDELFNSNKIYAELDRKASYRAINVSETEAIEYIKNGLD